MTARLQRPTTRIADQDQAFTWYYRVLGYNAVGAVVATSLSHSDHELERVHDCIASVPGVESTYTVGPFREARA